MQPGQVPLSHPSPHVVTRAPLTPTRADRTRDTLSVIALLVSLALDWNADTIALFRVEVAIVTVLSALSLVLPAASRRGLFGARWTPARLRALKMIVGVPYLIVVIGYVGWDISSRWTEWDYGGTGLGPAVWIGLAGAVLAAQPRDSDLFDVQAPDGSGVAERQSRLVLMVIGVVFAVMTAAAVVIDGFRFAESLDAIAGVRVGVLDPIVVAAAAITWLVIVGRLVLSAMSGTTGAALSLSLFGWASAGWALVVSIPAAPYESVDTVAVNYLGVAVLGGLGAAALSPALPSRPAMTQRDYYRGPLGLVMAVSALWVVLSVIRLTLYSPTAAVLGALVFFTLALAGATLVRDRMSNEPGDHRRLLLGFACGLLVAGLGVLVLMSLRVTWNQPAPMALWLIGVVVPAFIGWREVLAPALARNGVIR